jgi:uncharacterized membrane protein YjgN (DUF898 family)
MMPSLALASSLGHAKGVVAIRGLHYFAYSSHFGQVRFSGGTSNGPVVLLSITMPLITIVSGTGSLRS